MSHDEQDLLINRETFTKITDQSDDGYLIITGNDNIIFANPHASLYLSLPTETTKTSSFMALVTKQYRLEPAEAWQSWPHPSNMARYLLRPETETTKPFWLQVNTVNMNQQWVVILKDVTDQMATQRDIRKFHTLVYHKLRTPFIGILGRLNMMIGRARPLSNDEMYHHAEATLKEVKALFQNIEGVINYIQAPTRVISGLGFEVTQLPSLLAQVCAELSITSFSQPQIPPNLTQTELTLSPQAMELILWVTLENAYKFHPQQTPHIILLVDWADSRQTHITLQIKDNGLTLSPDQLIQMWHPYYQGEKSFTGEVTGFGLGLPLVSSLVWSVGGHCHAYNNNPLTGITIELTLPVAD